MEAPSPKRRSNVVALRRAPRTNVRAPLGPFIGREEVLRRIAGAIDEGARLVTLLGPPGIGKTRLAEELLSRLGSRYQQQGGAWLCELEAVRDAVGLAHAVASLWSSPLDAAHLADEDVDAQVAEHLALAGPLLLVLDNFEQLASAGSVVRRWCQRASSTCVVVTSRERLAVEGELVIELEPLGTPREDDSAADVLACEAVRLFKARAAAVGGELGADPHVLGALVRQLDGIPLAIELAAARTRLLGPGELVARLKQRFELLARHPRDAEGRHGTLASAIDWSWNLLSGDEQSALAECSVFAGGFSVEAAEHVIARGVADAPVVERVGALRDKSLVHASSHDGRLALFVSIREYAGGKLEARPEIGEAARLRHARYFAARVRAFNESRTFQGAQPDAELRRELSRDKENLLSAVGFLRDRPRASLEESALLGELSIGLGLLQAAPIELCRDAIGAALEALDASPGDDPTLRARLLLSRQGLLNSMGHFEESRQDLSRLLAIEGQPPGMHTLALAMQGIQLRYQALYRDAWESHVKAAAELESLDLPRLSALNWACMGRLSQDLGDAARAREYNERARALAADIGDQWLGGLPLANLAQLEQEEQRFVAAAELLEQAMARFREAQEPQYIALYTAVRGDLSFEQGKPDEARRWYAAAAPFLGGWVAHRGTAMLHAAWGALEAQHGDVTLAEAQLERARRSVRRGNSASARLFLELSEASLALRVKRDANDAAGLAAEVARWCARVDALESGRAPDHDDLACSLDARFALRILKRGLAGGLRQECPSLLVGKNAAWFSIGDDVRVDLLRRGSLRRILAALIAAHESHPDAALDHGALLAEGWPGERLLADAASTRLRVAIATLRRLGLREVILTRDDGYLLHPALRIKGAG